MVTASGKRIFPQHDTANHTGEVPTLQDIAIGMGRQVRFAGQTREFYTVLCHVLTVADIVDPRFRRQALLHDAAEAIMSDVPTTWKPNEFKILEAEIVEPLSLENRVVWTQEAHDAVAAADYAALVGEAHALGHAAAEHYWPRAEMSMAAELAEKITLQRLDRGEPEAFIGTFEASYAFMAAWRAAG